MPKSRTLILGLGNTLRQDDGVGPGVIEKLRGEALADTDLQIGGTDGLTLLEDLRKYPRAIVIDAVDMGLRAGEVKLFTPEDVRVKVKTDSLSTHGFGLAEVIELMSKLDIQTELKIIGVQPESIDFGEGLGEEVSNSLGDVVNLVREQL